MPSLSDEDIALKVSTSADTSGLEKASGGIDDLTKTTNSASKTAVDMSKKFGDGMKKVAIVSGVVAAGLTAYAKSATNYVTGLVADTKTLSRQTGLTNEESSKLLAVTGRLGLSTGQITASFGAFSKVITDSRDKTGEVALKQADLKNKIEATKIKITDLTNEIAKNGDKSGELHNKVQALNIDLQEYQKKLTATSNPLQKLHIATTNANGSARGFNDILLDVADKFKTLPDGAEKTALSMQLFGRSGKDLIKVLNLGSDGIRDLEAQADKLGLTLTSQNIVAVDKYVQSQKDLKATTDSLKLAVGTLATPVMTAFNEKLNSILTTLISADSPFRTITADILAFGGPIAGAVAGTAAFAGNVATAIPGIIAASNAVRGWAITQGALNLVMRATPLGWLVTGLTVLVGAVALVTRNFNAQNSQAQQLKATQDSLRVATDNLRNAQNSLKDAELNEKGAALAVEGAKRAQKAAIAQYGKGSYEAREATYQLQVAEDNQRKSSQRAKDAQDELRKAQAQVAKDKSIIDHLKQVAAQAQNVGNNALQAGMQIKRIDGSKITVKTTKGPMGNQVIDFAATFGRRAKGGPVSAGQPYLVGENADGTPNSTSEMFVPSQSGTILSAKDTQKVLAGAGGGGFTYNHNGDVYLGDASAVREYFSTINRNSQLARRGMTTSQGIA